MSLSSNMVAAYAHVWLLYIYAIFVVRIGVDKNVICNRCEFSFCDKRIATSYLNCHECMYISEKLMVTKTQMFEQIIRVDCCYR